MNWLNRHIKTFVIPHLASMAGGRVINMNMRLPREGFDHEEGIRLYLALKAAGYANTNVLTYLLKTGSHTHMSALFGNNYTSKITGMNLDVSLACHSFIKSTLRSLHVEAKKTNKTIILTGRDMWLWEVLARKMGIPTVYDPRISRHSAANYDALMNAVIEWGVDLNKCILYDTGWNGTIWKHICKMSGDKPTSIMLSAEEKKHQQWPSLSSARDIAYKIEDTPKYWSSGSVGSAARPDGRVAVVAKQGFASDDEFIMATALTIWAWHCQSPNFVHSEKYKGLWSESKLAQERSKKRREKNKHLTKNRVARTFIRKMKADTTLAQLIKLWEVSNGVEGLACIVCAVDGLCEACKSCHHVYHGDALKIEWATQCISDAGPKADKLVRLLQLNHNPLGRKLP